MTLEHENQDIYDKTSFYKVYRFIFHVTNGQKTRYSSAYFIISSYYSKLEYETWE